MEESSSNGEASKPRPEPDIDILELVSSTAQELLRTKNWELTANQVLERLGKTLQLDNIFIFKNQENGGKSPPDVTQAYSWCSSGDGQAREPGLGKSQEKLSAEELKSWKPTLLKDEVVQGNRDKLTGKSQLPWLPENVRSVAVVPIFVEQDWWGFIGFGQHEKDRVWSGSELKVLKTVAGTMGAAIQRKRMTEALKESEEKYRNLVERANDGVIIIQDGIMTFLNQRAADMVGHRLEEVINKPFKDFVHPEEVPKIVERYKKRLAGDTIAPIYETLIKHKDGHDIHVELNAGLISYEGKAADLVFVRDISERKKVEEETRKLAAMVRHSSELVNMSTLEGNMTFINEAGGRMLGIDPTNMKGVHIMEVIPDHLKETVEKEVVPLLLQGKTWEGDLQYRNLKTGKLTDVHALAFTIKDQETGKPLFLANVSMDITERKKAEEALHFTKFAVDRSSDAAFWMGADAKFIYVNDAACKKLGYTREELLQMKVYDIDPNFPERAWPAHWEQVKRQGSFSMDSQHRTKDGTVFPVEIKVNFVEFGGKEYNCTFVRDITRRKQNEEELRDKNRQLEVADKLKSEFVGIVSHDFGSPLSIILSASELLLMTEACGELSPKAQEKVEIIKATVKRLNRLRLNTLDISKMDLGQLKVDLKKGDLTNFIYRAVNVMRPLAENRGQSLQVSCDAGVEISYDPERILQALENYIGNAINYTSEGGRILVVLRKQKDQIVVEVKDNGRGIKPEELENVFLPFYRTGERVRGSTGLGLSIVRGIIHGHRGRAWAESQGPGTGSSFFFTLPKENRDLSLKTLRTVPLEAKPKGERLYNES